MKEVTAVRAFRWIGMCSLLCTAAYATDVNVGFVSFDVSFPPNVGAFDISNLTGTNSSPAPATDFPITTAVSLSNLDLVVTFVGGSTETFGPGSKYFTLSPDGISFDGTASFNISTAPVMSAVLTGTFGTTSLTLNDGSHLTISPNFKASVTDTSGVLANGDFALITATTGSGPPPTVPEPASWFLLAGGLALLLGANLRKRISWRNAAKPFLMVLPCLVVVHSAWGSDSVTLATWTVPSSGVAGTNNVWVTGSNFPSGTIPPADVTVSFASSCAATTGVTTEKAIAVTNIVGGTDRVEFLIPAGLSTTKYFVWLSGTSSSGVAFTSSNCAAVDVTHVSPILASCNPGSSMGLISPNKLPSGTTPVTAYVPNARWGGGPDNVRVVPIEGSGTVGSVTTPTAVNSCSSDSITGETVCTSNGTDVYLITGTTLNKTLTSGATGFASFSGGSCMTCGVAVNSVANQAVIQIGLTSSNGLQFIDLKTNTVGTPVPSVNEVSEDILWDPFSNFILSPNERSNYDIFKVTGSGLPGPSTAKEFANAVSGAGEFDSAGEDCTTHIALASIEFTGKLYIADLSQAKFTSGTPGTWSAPSQVQNFIEFEGLAAGTTALAVAPGSTHLGIVGGEFGGNLVGAIQLPSKSGTGTPAVVDYVAATIPADPGGRTFSNGFDPHTVTAYTSPNNGKAYGVAADWASGSPDYVAVIDLQALLSAPRTAGTHSVDPAYDLLAHGVIRYVKTF